MKNFKELNKELTLIKSSMDSLLGTKYIDSNLPRDEMIVVSHLDSDLAIEFFPVYLSLYAAIINWINSNPIVREYVFMPELVEVGEDYMTRRFYVYYVSIRNYFADEDEDEEGYIEPPELFEKMISAVSKELDDMEGKEGVIRRILTRSLLEPTGKTIFSNRIDKFIIVEPKLLLANLIQWKALAD